MPLFKKNIRGVWHAPGAVCSGCLPLSRCVRRAVGSVPVPQQWLGHPVPTWSIRSPGRGRSEGKQLWMPENPLGRHRRAGRSLVKAPKRPHLWLNARPFSPCCCVYRSVMPYCLLTIKLLAVNFALWCRIADTAPAAGARADVLGTLVWAGLGQAAQPGPARRGAAAWEALILVSLNFTPEITNAWKPGTARRR